MCWLFFALLLVGGALAAKPYDSRRCKGKFPCMIFEDNFDKFDFKTWHHEIAAGGGGNWEFQIYANNRSNSYVKDGILYLKPTLSEEQFSNDWLYNGAITIWGNDPPSLCTGHQWSGCERHPASNGNIINPIKSARIRTARSFAFRYGRLEVEAKMPLGDWIWPAIWMLPEEQAYGGWPASGEIDIMESRGNLYYKNMKGEQVGCTQVGSTLHYAPYWGLNGWDKAHGRYNLHNGRSFADDFHVYRMDWDERGLFFYVDDVLMNKVETKDGYWKRGGWDKELPADRNVWQDSNPDAPFDRPFHIIMNVAVGGTGGYFDDAKYQHPPYAKPWLDTSGTAMKDFWENRNLWLPTWPKDDKEDDRAMQINYIRVWKLKEDCFITGTCK